MITPGSGGFGPVAERDTAAIGRDLVDGYVTERAAREDYGIADPAALRADAAKDEVKGSDPPAPTVVKDTSRHRV